MARMVVDTSEGSSLRSLIEDEAGAIGCMARVSWRPRRHLTYVENKRIRKVRHVENERIVTYVT